jgi:multidrug resistance protein
VGDRAVARRSRAPLPKGFWPIWTTVALDLVGFGIVVPILGRYAERFGAGGIEVGLMFASFSVAQMICAPFLGRLSDRIGRKPVIIVSLLGTALGSFITGAAGALWVLFLGRIIDGASGASVAVAQGAIADISTPEERPKLMGLLGAAFGLGFVLGPIIGGLAALGGPHVPFFLAGSVALANAVAAAIRLPETKPSRDSAAPATSRSLSLPKSPVQLRFALMALVASLGFSGFEATFSLFGERRFGLTESSTALVFLAVGVTLVAVQGAAIGPLTRRFGSRTLLLGGLLTTAAGLVVLSGANVIPVLLVAVVIIAFGQGVSSPSVTSIVTELVPPERRGEALGYQQSAGALGRITGPIVAGAIFDGLNEGAPYLISAALFMAAYFVVRSVRSTTSSH